MQREKFRQTRVLSVSGVDYTMHEFTPRNVNFGEKLFLSSQKPNSSRLNPRSRKADFCDIINDKLRHNPQAHDDVYLQKPSEVEIAYISLCVNVCVSV
jgi:hypothetical protein